jgi:hypothetical protein
MVMQDIKSTTEKNVPDLRAILMAMRIGCARHVRATLD